MAKGSQTSSVELSVFFCGVKCGDMMHGIRGLGSVSISF